MRPSSLRKLLRASCALTLVGLAFCLWSLLWPSVPSVMLALSVAQGIGTLAFVLYLAVLYFDLRLQKTLPQALQRPRKDDK